MNTVLTFPGVSSKDYGKNIVRLTRSNKDDPSTEFLKGLDYRNIAVVDFDSVKDDLDKLRDSDGKNMQKLKSVDAFFRSSNGKFYFIEFKKSTSEALNKIGNHVEYDEKEKIDVSFRKKAFDSITLSGITTTQDINGVDLMKNAVLIVAYKSSARDSLSAIDFNTSLTSRANGCSAAIQYPTQWGLDELKTAGLYSDVHTWPDNKFESWAVNNLK